MKRQNPAGIISNIFDQPSTETRQEGKWYYPAKIGWIILMLVALILLITSLPGYYDQIKSGVPGHGPETTRNVPLQIVTTIMSLVSAGLSLWLSLLLFRRRFNNPAVAVVSLYLLIYGVILTGPLEVWCKYWLGNTDFALTVQTLLMATPTIALLSLFPSGTFVPRWTRWLIAVTIPWNFIAVFYPITNNNITGLVILSILWIPAIGLGLYAQIYRYRKISSPMERQQTKWVLFGFSIWLGYVLVTIYPYFYLENLPPGSPLPWWTSLNEIGWWASLNIIPISLTVAITRSRLWNIDIVINRTLVYGILTLTTMLIYVFVVGVLGILLNTGTSTFVAFLTTGLIAVIFSPLRDRLQSWVNRMMYGERDDPVAVLTKLGGQIENTGSPQSILDTIVETVAKTLKIPYAAIELGEANEIATSFGILVGEPVRLQLIYQGKNVGCFVVGKRSPDEAFSLKDMQLLENISRQAGAAAYNALLTADLQRARKRLVATREEERRRIRRDLHDGLGPQLASQTLTLNAIEKLIDRDPENAKNLIRGLQVQSQDAITSIRHLIYELRPPALDELGLAEALKEGSANYRGTVQVEIEAPTALPQLPAAVEVAAYHITQEAIVNAIRHAQASLCHVWLGITDKNLHIKIEDDGQGFPDNFQAGIGLQSMRERASELNGSIEFKSSSGKGICVQVLLPILKEES
jgi:signal transduction histidine kinase